MFWAPLKNILGNQTFFKRVFSVKKHEHPDVHKRSAKGWLFILITGLWDSLVDGLAYKHVAVHCF